jgi:hypothetical protein
VVSRARLRPALDLQQSGERRRPRRERPTHVRAGALRTPFQLEQAPEVHERPHRRHRDKRHRAAWWTVTVDRVRAPSGARRLEPDRLRTDCHEPGVQQGMPGSVLPGRDRPEVRPARYCHKGQRNGSERWGEPSLGAHPSGQPKPQRTVKRSSDRSIANARFSTEAAMYPLWSHPRAPAQVASCAAHRSSAQALSGGSRRMCPLRWRTPALQKGLGVRLSSLGHTRSVAVGGTRRVGESTCEARS